MAYIGQKPFQEFSSIPTKDSFTGDGSTTTFDLANDVVRGAENSLEVFIDNVRQEPGSGKAFTLGIDGSSNYRRITFSSAPANGASIYVINDKTNLTTIAPLNTDFNGVELVLDADSDTTLHAETDDQVDLRIAGVDVLKFLQSSGDAVLKPMVDAKDIIFQQFDGNKIFEINDGNFVGVGGNATAPGEIRIFEDSDNGTNYSGFKAAASTTSSVAYQLPAADGSSGTQLTTDGSGVLSWSAAGVTLANDANNRIVTATGSGLNGESGLTFDGSTLALTGALTVSTDASVGDDLTLGSDAAVVNFGADSEIKLTHVADTGLLLTDSGGSPTLQLHDANESVSSDGSKLILTSNGVAFSLPTADGSSGEALTTNGSGVLSFSAVSANTPSSADGQALGSASLEWSDLFLADGSTIQFGNDQDVILTHVADTGILLSGTNVIQFNDASQNIGAPSNAILDINATDEIELNATLVDVNANLDVSGTITSGGVITGTAFTAGSAVLAEAELELLDGLTAGTAIASKVVTTDANIDSTGMRNLTISGEIDAATGDFSGAIDVAGTANLDVVDIDGAVDMASTLQVDGVITTSDGMIITTADNTDTLSLISTDADAAQGPNLRLYRNSGSPADNDVLGMIDFEGRNDNSQDVIYVQMESLLADASDGTEDGYLNLSVMLAGTLRSRIEMDPGETVINEASMDLDFRVESNGNANMIFVDGGSDHVNIGTATDLGGVLNVAGTAVIQTADNSDTLTLISTDADANVGPVLNLNRNSSSASDDDNIGNIVFTGNDSAGNSQTYYTIDVRASDATNGDEDGTIFYTLPIAGSDIEMLRQGPMGSIFNEGGAAINFRVESDSQASMFTIDGTNNKVGVGAAPAHTFSVNDVLSGGTAIEGVTSTNSAIDGNQGTLILKNTANRAAGKGPWISFAVSTSTSGNGATEDGSVIAAIADNSTNGSRSQAILFRTRNSGTAEHFRIGADGTLTGTDTSIGSNSDERLKENISDYTYDLAKFKNFKPRTFTWKNPEFHNAKYDSDDAQIPTRGFVAQELNTVDNYWTDTVNVESEAKEDQDLIPADAGGLHKAFTAKLGKKDAMYISTIQQLITKIETLETKVQTLEDA